jgi:hypothetical protein
MTQYVHDSVRLAHEQHVPVALLVKLRPPMALKGSTPCESMASALLRSPKSALTCGGLPHHGAAAVPVLTQYVCEPMARAQ